MPRTAIVAGCRSPGVALVIGLNVWAATAGDQLSQGGWQIDGSEAARAEALVADRFGEQATSLIVILTDPDGDAASPEFQATVAESVAPLEDEALVSEILTYADVGDPSFLSRDGTKTFALVRLDDEVEDAVDDAEHLAGLVDAPAGVDTIVTGIPLVQYEFNEAIEEDLFRAEVISLPIAMLILLAVFGTLVGAALPVIIAVLALPSAMAIIGLLAGVTEMSIFVTNVATMIGLALSIDYSLFTVSRFREELRHRSVADAVEHTMATVGKAVAISGIAVAIGLASLTVFESAALRSMGIGGVVTVLSTLVFGLTVLPALLGMLGPRVNRLRVPLPKSLRLIEDDPDAADARQGHGYWGRMASVVMRHPVAIATPLLIVLIVAGLPVLRHPALDRRKPRRPSAVAERDRLPRARGRVPRWRRRPDRGRRALRRADRARRRAGPDLDLRARGIRGRSCRGRARQRDLERPRPAGRDGRDRHTASSSRFPRRSDRPRRPASRPGSTSGSARTSTGSRCSARRCPTRARGGRSSTRCAPRPRRRVPRKS